MDDSARFIGHDPRLEVVRNTVQRVLSYDFREHCPPPVLIQGETGTGKGLLARVLHERGPRRNRSFVEVNCAAIPEGLLEAELFGFERGAFTDAHHAKPGLFQSAHRGTIFLDEVALIPQSMQAKLLKIVEDREVRRLGSTRMEPIDVWIIAATNADLARSVRLGRIRDDFYHRIAVLTLTLPPLRALGHDILELGDHFLRLTTERYGLPPRSFAPETRARLLEYCWPGNVRQLRHVIERAALLADGPIIEPEDFDLHGGPELSTLRDPKTDDAEARQLRAVLLETDWNISQAACRLQISRNTLRHRIAKHGLRPETPVS